MPQPPEAPPVRVVVHMVRVPLRTPIRSARSSQESRGSVLVEVHTADGAVGWGECPALDGSGYSTETLEVAWDALCTRIAPAALMGTVPVVAGVPAALGALRDAVLDARLRAAGVRLLDHLTRRLEGEPTGEAPAGGDAPTDSVPWCAVLADVGVEPAHAVEVAHAAVAEGASMVKLKVDGARDGVGVLEEVRRVVGIPVAADANGSLDRPGTLRLDGVGLAYLEQPLPTATPWDHLAELARDLVTPVALDESIASPDAVRDALQAGAMALVSVKPARLGGVDSAATAARVARAGGVTAFVGGMFELGVGRATAAALAAALRRVDGPGAPPADLGPTGRYLGADVTAPLALGPDGAVVVPAGPGWGPPPDPGALDAHLVQRQVIGR